jgi:photosystem II stability/assembly factor-like uncharacterized protein
VFLRILNEASRPPARNQSELHQVYSNRPRIVVFRGYQYTTLVSPLPLSRTMGGMNYRAALSLLLLTTVSAVQAQSLNLSELKLRSLGPSLTTGRITDIAVDPRNRSVWYAVAGSGGLWKTTNRGNTWQPIFDSYGSFCLGSIAIDEKNPDTLWLGTGEAASQRSASFGDGVYKSTDGGKSWERMGLATSEHIAKILIDPRNSDTVWVAAQGPLWAAGGERGLYKTTDGGKTWQAVLTIDENTGATDICFDPRNPDTVYAATYQRRRHVGQLISGGGGAGVFKTTDGGKTWERLKEGLPTTNLGRIALAVSPQKPDVVYAQIGAAKQQIGFFKSENGGKSWTRTGDCPIQDQQYYGEIICDPNVFDKVYVMDMTIQVTENGGKTFSRLNWPIHPDNHALVFDPTDPLHLIVGNDGGVYETYDSGRSFRHFTNLPISQFYRVALDDAQPFYNIYGGAQDNGSIGGPSRTPWRAGIRTSEWLTVGGGDGMGPAIEPGDPDTLYTQSQNAALVRLDRRTGESTFIRPQAPKGEKLRFHWDAPLLISPHKASRVYLAGNKLWQSDDRGTTWKAISPDLTRQLDPNKLPVMGKLWTDDEVANRNTFTTDLSVITAFDESPKRGGLLYAGTDDGLIQVSEDGGKTWRQGGALPGVPERAYINDLYASRTDDRTIWAVAQHYQFGDFTPYVFRSDDRGRTWTSIRGDLPARHVAWSLVADTKNPNLLFLGTEFALFTSVDGGAHWTKLEEGAPTIAFRDIHLHPRDGDLVAGTFGRGVYVLDDAAALRHATPENLTRPAWLFPPRRTYVYRENSLVTTAWGNTATPNPPLAMLTYHLKEFVPDTDAPLQLRILDSKGKEVRSLPVSGVRGLHRLSWDLRANAPAATDRQPQRGPRQGPLLAPGKYRVELGRRSSTDSKWTALGNSQPLELLPLPDERRRR